MNSFSLSMLACLSGLLLAACSEDEPSTKVNSKGQGGEGQGGEGQGGEGQGGEDEPVVIPDECEVLEVGELEPDQVPGHFVTTATGKSLGDARLYIKQRNLTSVLEPGEADLSEPPNDDYETCTHCVLVLDGSEIAEEADKVLFQTSGSMIVDIPIYPPSTETKGRLKNVVLREVDIDPLTYHVTPKANGKCFGVGINLRWNTLAPLDSPCESVDDCGNPLTRICNPTTGTCTEPMCGDGVSCPDGQACVAQSDEATKGACYVQCTPFASGCPTGMTCKVVKTDQSAGLCYPDGPGAANTPCQMSIVTTGCESGYVCSSEIGAEESDGFCRQICDYLSPAPACPMIQTCVPGSVCSNDAVDPAQFEQPCDPSSWEGTPCALQGQAARGICAVDSNAVETCRKVCRVMVAEDCVAPQICQEYYSGDPQSLGICIVPDLPEE